MKKVYLLQYEVDGDIRFIRVYASKEAAFIAAQLVAHQFDLSYNELGYWRNGYKVLDLISKEVLG